LTGLEHLGSKVLLFHLIEFEFEFFIVDRFAERGTCDGVADFFAQGVLFAEFFSAGGVNLWFSCGLDEWDCGVLQECK
jgi:hypothetical protein